ncbi:MAG: hypothetical protein IJY08_00330 [Clostridia bacterium]|nr:hypothetical protein [Clostridia bacterium]
MKSEDRKVIKKYRSNSTLALTELWLRNESKCGWRLTDVNEQMFHNTYTFVKCSPSDDVYFGLAYFNKEPKHTRIALSVLDYLRHKYSGKQLSASCCMWIKIPQSQITDINDLKNNLLIREKYIRMSYLQWSILWTVPFVIFLLLAVMWQPYIYSLTALCGIGAFISAIKLINHKINCDKVYKNFIK